MPKIDIQFTMKKIEYIIQVKNKLPDDTSQEWYEIQSVGSDKQTAITLWKQVKENRKLDYKVRLIERTTHEKRIR